MRRRLQSFVVTAGLLVSAVAIPVATAAPADATAKSCRSYLQSKGYIVGPKVKNICKETNSGWEVGPCIVALHDLGVKESLAEKACRKAIQ